MPNNHSTISIIGVLDNGLDSLNRTTRLLIQRADTIIAGTRLLELCQPYQSHAVCLDLTGKLSQVPIWILDAYQQHQHIVILASGDPLCHGIGSYLKKKISDITLSIFPNLSTMQLACARIGLAWQDLHICSIHTQDHGDWCWKSQRTHSLYNLAQAVRQHHKIGLFTSPENNPQRIVRLLQTLNMGSDWQITVAQDLMSEHESVLTRLRDEDVLTQTFSDNNIVILQRTHHSKQIIFGIEDDQFVQRKPDKGLMTKYEVRAVSLAHMKLQHDSIVWDIGAGSGAVGLEASQVCQRGHVYAIEKNLADYDIVCQNQQRMRATNYSIQHGKAPKGLEAWPNPNTIFIGGSGGELTELIQLCLHRLQPNGILVMNFVTLENMSTALETLKQLNTIWNVCQLQISCRKPILHMNRLQALNPVWIISAQQKDMSCSVN